MQKYISKTILISVTLCILLTIFITGYPKFIVNAASEIIPSMFTINSGQETTINCSGDNLAVSWVDSNLPLEQRKSVKLKCITNATPTPAPTPTSSASNIPPLPRPSSSIDPKTIQECPTHDPNKWHGLYDPTKNCHYDHEHLDNPHYVDDIFGPVGQLYGNQEISYPWQTFKGSGEGYPAMPTDHIMTEQGHKHEGYGWLVRRNMPCLSVFGDGCFTDMRVQVHAIMAGIDAAVRFHSYWVEAKGCDEANPKNCGIIRTGGWQDYKNLFIDNKYIPIAGDHKDGAIKNGKSREHSTGPYIAPNVSPISLKPDGGNKHFGTWYGSGRVGLAILSGDMWGTIDYLNPTQTKFFCEDGSCGANGSQLELHILSATINGTNYPGALKNGRINFKGYTDRYGKIVTNCTSVGLDCIPLELINMPAVGSYQYRDLDFKNRTPYLQTKEYDVAPKGVNWIQFPN